MTPEGVAWPGCFLCLHHAVLLHAALLLAVANCLPVPIRRIVESQN